MARSPYIDLFEKDLLAFWRDSGLSKKSFTDKYHFTNHLFVKLERGNSVGLETIEKAYGIFHDEGWVSIRAGQVMAIEAMEEFEEDPQDLIAAARMLQAFNAR